MMPNQCIVQKVHQKTETLSEIIHVSNDKCIEFINIIYIFNPKWIEYHNNIIYFNKIGWLNDINDIIPNIDEVQSDRTKTH